MPEKTIELVIADSETTDPLIIWAQELFSIFILAVASQVEEVLGVAGIHSDDGMVQDDALFQKIAGFLVDAELAANFETAYMLIIPAFLHCGLF